MWTHVNIIAHSITPTEDTGLAREILQSDSPRALETGVGIKQFTCVWALNQVHAFFDQQNTDGVMTKVCLKFEHILVDK